MFFLLLHSLALLTLSFLAARSLWLGLADRLLAVAALVWANIVVTCLVLSCAHGLGDRGWFFRIAIADAGELAGLMDDAAYKAYLATLE